MSRIGARARRALRRGVPAVGGTGPATGGFDRVHDGLVSGWLACPACGTPPTPLPHLLVNGRPVHATAVATPRGDVPGGLGFLLRFPPTGAAGTRVRVQCPAHPEHGLEIQADAEAWGVGVLGAMETSTWPMVTGWLAVLDPAAGDVTLVIEGRGRVPVSGVVSRPDVAAYLGSAGVGGFQVDLGSAIGASVGPPDRIALPDSTALRLAAADRVLATAEVRDSPLGPDTAGCLAGTDGRRSGPDEQELANLRRRFLMAEIDTDGDWRYLLTRLGLEDHSPETAQWADYLADRGFTTAEIVGWLALRATQRLAASAMNPLPLSLAALPDADKELPPALGNWLTTVEGVHYDSFPFTMPDPAPPVPDQVDKVLVAGLVHHRSGLGQNARNSLRALDLAGIHGCAAPFFPAPGGWNPDLRVYSDAARSLDDHAVLLHLPIDRVIPSLSAQPALMRTDRLIGYFMWETEAIPRQFHRALDIVDEIWTATSFVADALRAVTDTPVHVTGHVVETTNVTPVSRASLGIAEDAFVVHYAFDANSTVARKNPNAAIDAFHQAFRADPSAVFVLKVRNMQQVHALARAGDPHARDLLQQLDDDPAIRVITGEHDHAYALGLIALADCYVSLHRSEGYGYGIAEAMALGTPVIATDYSGSTDLATNQTAWLVGYDKQDVLPGEYFYWEPGMTWAEPHIEFAAMLLHDLRNGGGIRDVTAAQVNVERSASVRALSEQYGSLLGGTRASGPPRGSARARR